MISNIKKDLKVIDKIVLNHIQDMYYIGLIQQISRRIMMHLRKLSGIFNLIESGQIIRAFIEITINLLNFNLK